jgi:hypothetical protein
MPANQIVHDAEHYILLQKHGEKWAAEDKSTIQDGSIRMMSPLVPKALHCSITITGLPIRVE